MKGTNRNYLFLSLLAVLLFSGCRKDESLVNESRVISIPIDLNETTIMPYYAVDNSGRYLFIFLRDFLLGNSKVLKINLENRRIEKELIFDATILENITVPIMYDNIVVTDKNELICGFYKFRKGKQMLLKFDLNLNILKADTVADVSDGRGGNYGRTRLVKSGPGKITGVYGNLHDSTQRWYWRYQNMDENLQILNQVEDTSIFYADGPWTPQSFIKTSDGGYLLDANNNYGDALIEKRDETFHLLWRKKYSGASPVTLNELNGKYYVYCHYDSLFTLMYDVNGNLLNKKILNLPGALLSKNYEQMRKTENGEFLMTAIAYNTNNPLGQNGVIFHTDANSNIISTKFFGRNNVLGSGLIKKSSNQYILFYLDNTFKPDGAGSPRIVIQYIDAKGNYLD